MLAALTLRSIDTSGKTWRLLTEVEREKFEDLIGNFCNLFLAPTIIFTLYLMSIDYFPRAKVADEKSHANQLDNNKPNEHSGPDTSNRATQKHKLSTKYDFVVDQQSLMPNVYV